MKQDAEHYRSKSVRAAAERVLAQTFGGAVRLEEPQGVWVFPDECRRTLQRATVLDGPSGMPATVILKRIHGEDPFDPEDVRPIGGSRGDGTVAWRLIGEWTGTQFLGSLPHEPPLSPRCYGGDRAEGFVVLEDLGAGARILDLLLGDDPFRAEAALLSYATVLGRIHALTMGREAEYEGLRSALTAQTIRYREFEAGLFPRNWRRIQELREGLGLSWPAGADDDVERVSAAAGEPGPFLAFTQGDYAPANDMVIGGEVRLFDFERGAFRHALFDGVVKRHLHPWRQHRYPEVVQRRFETRYRAELARGCPEAADDERFTRADLEMRAAWMLRNASGDLAAALAGEWWSGEGPAGEQPPPQPTVRQYLLLMLDDFAAATEAAGHLERLGDIARRLANRLRALWQPELYELPLFPAFACMAEER
jgi:hypothetical protein